MYHLFHTTKSTNLSLSLKPFLLHSYRAVLLSKKFTKLVAVTVLKQAETISSQVFRAKLEDLLCPGYNGELRMRFCILQCSET